MVWKEDRFVIVAHHKRRMSIPLIAKALKLRREQVHCVVQRFKETGWIEDRQRSGRPRITMISVLRNMVKKKIQRNPQRSIRKSAKEHNVDCESIRRLVRDICSSSRTNWRKDTISRTKWRRQGSKCARRWNPSAAVILWTKFSSAMKIFSLSNHSGTRRTNANCYSKDLSVSWMCKSLFSRCLLWCGRGFPDWERQSLSSFQKASRSTQRRIRS